MLLLKVNLIIKINLKYINEFNSHEFDKNANILLYKVLCDQKNIKEKVKYFIKHGEKNE